VDGPIFKTRIELSIGKISLENGYGNLTIE